MSHNEKLSYGTMMGVNLGCCFRNEYNTSEKILQTIDLNKIPSGDHDNWYNIVYGITEAGLNRKTKAVQKLKDIKGYVRVDSGDYNNVEFVDATTLLYCQQLVNLLLNNEEASIARLRLTLPWIIVYKELVNWGRRLSSTEK